MRIVAVVAASSTLAAVSMAPIGGSSGNFSLEQARAVADFPVYFAGEEVDGLPLTAVHRRDDTANYVSFVYGDCDPGSDGGCAPPAEVQVWPTSARSLASYEGSVPGTPVPEATTIRGHPAAFIDDSQLEIYAGDATIVVFADSRPRALAIARELRCVIAGVVPREESLGC